MNHLVGASGQVTLAKPIRVALPNADFGSVRAVAFDGTLRAVEDGMATFEVDSWILHPDDVEPHDPPRLDLWAASDDGGTTPVHVSVALIQSIAL